MSHESDLLAYRTVVKVPQDVRKRRSPTSNFWFKAFPTSNFLKTQGNCKENASHRM